jgi:thioredoxin reductase (NADPH)
MNTKPVILTVDDDPEVLGAIERDLRRRYRDAYRIVAGPSGPQALDAARELQRRGTAVALFLADQRMPGMTGTQFLQEARKLHPAAKRALLTAYADSEAAIAAINEVGLDHYLMKPWDPPDQRLYPVLDDLLGDWSAHAKPSFEGVRVVGSRWSPQSYATRDFLSRNQIPYRWIDIEQDAPMRELLQSTVGDGQVRLPVVLLADGTLLAQPTLSELAAKTGLQTAPERPYYDLAIVGAGPAGLACAVYGASEGLKVVLIEQNAPGG